MKTTVGVDLICERIANTGTSANQLAYICISSDTTQPGAGDVMPLAGEFARLAATVAYTLGTGELFFSATYTATGSVTPNKAALTDNATPGAGVLAFESLNAGANALTAGMTYTQTVTVTVS